MIVIRLRSLRYVEHLIPFSAQEMVQFFFFSFALVLLSLMCVWITLSNGRITLFYFYLNMFLG